MNQFSYGEVIKSQFYIGKVYPSFEVESDKDSLFASQDFFNLLGLNSEKIEVMFKPMVREREEWCEGYLRRSETLHQFLLSYDKLAGPQSRNIFYASLDWYLEYSFPVVPLHLILRLPAKYFFGLKKVNHKHETF